MKPLLFCLVATALIALLSPAFAEAPKKIDPSRWEKEIATIEAKTKASGQSSGAILFVGSSSIRLWDLERDWAGVPVLNHGFGGSTLPDTVHYFERLVTPFAPKAVVVYAGDNDIGSFGRTAGEVAADFAKLAEKMDKQLPGVPLVYIAIKPSVKRWKLWLEMKAANDAIAKTCAEHKGFRFADISAPMLAGREGAPSDEWFKEDGLHLTPKGYAEWTKVIRKELVGVGALAE